jgi:hypothetical protein
MDTGEIRPVDAGPEIGLHPRISADGNYVAYDTESGVYRRDMLAGTTDLVAPANGGAATAGSISADGNVVAFTSNANAFVRNFATGLTTQVSAGPDGTPLNGPAYAPAISGDAHFVAFVARIGGGRAAVYRKDLGDGALQLVSSGIDLAPRTLVDAPLGKLPRRKARSVTGSAQDDSAVVRVDVSMSRSIGHGRCLWLGRRSKVVRGRCARPVWVRARLVNGLRFSLQIRRLLPRGKWRLRTRALDERGTLEPARSGSNSVTLRLT